MNDEKNAILDNIQGLELKKPADMIVVQIKKLVSAGALKAGDRLPAERAFAKRLGVGRGHIREALKKLETLGILKTMPQSGTYVAQIDAKALDALMDSSFSIENIDMDSVMETRRILEVHAARFAAERATKSDIIALIKAHEEFRKQVRNKDKANAEDHAFHLKIAECSKNKVMQSLITLLAVNRADSEGKGGGIEKVILEEHEAILQAIKQKDPDRAAEAMDAHMNRTLNDRKTG